MRALYLPDGRLLVPVDLDNPGDGFGLAEIGPAHPDYGKWLAVAEEGEDPRPAHQEGQGP